jgi:hypothetical protein
MIFKEKQLRSKMKIVETMRELYEALEGESGIFRFSDINEQDALEAIQKTIWTIEDEIGLYAHFGSFEDAEKERERRIEHAKKNNYEICDFFFSPKTQKHRKTLDELCEIIKEQKSE